MLLNYIFSSPLSLSISLIFVRKELISIRSPASRLLKHPLMDEFHQLGGSCSSRLPFSFSSSAAPSAAAPLPAAAAGTSLFCELMSANRNPGPAKLEPGSVFQYSLHDTDQYSMKAKIVSHPHYPALLAAYIDCQKVGAPPEVAARLSAVAGELQERQQAGCRRVAPAAADPELDQFMEAYCNMLLKYKEELGRPLQDAMDYLRKVESQLSSLTNGAAASFLSSAADEKLEEVLSSEEDHDSGAEAEVSGIDPRSEDKEIKLHLLKKYSGYLGSLRQELSKKRKKGKLPKDARQKLLNWWELHYKWPYPSETEKLALAESTGLDQKQINNWFINQRKRHWKPSEDMQFVVMDSFHPQNAAAFYMGGQFLADGNYRFGL